jgi:hypothetical protein
MQCINLIKISQKDKNIGYKLIYGPKNLALQFN